MGFFSFVLLVVRLELDCILPVYVWLFGLLSIYSVLTYQKKKKKADILALVEDLQKRQFHYILLIF